MPVYRIKDQHLVRYSTNIVSLLYHRQILSQPVPCGHRHSFVCQAEFLKLTVKIPVLGNAVSGVVCYFNYYAELETAGKCFEWVKDHLALDEVGVYLDQKMITDAESKYLSLYDYLSTEVGKVPPGANGVIFTPVAPREPLPLRGLEGRRNVFQYPDRQRKERYDQSRP